MTDEASRITRLDEIEEWRNEWKGKLSIVGVLATALVTVLSSLVTLIAQHFLG